MISSVLRSKRAVMVTVQIMRALVPLRQMLEAHVDLARPRGAETLPQLMPSRRGSWVICAVVRMFYNDHAPPHFHAEYGDTKS